MLGFHLSVVTQISRWLGLAKTNVSPEKFWAITAEYPDLVCWLHVQIRMMGWLGLNRGIPWLLNIDEALCFVCKSDTETLDHFLFNCPAFHQNFEIIWSSLNHKIKNCNPVDADNIIQFILNLDKGSKTMLLLGCLPLPFNSMTMSVIIRFITLALSKMYKIRKINCESWRPHGFLCDADFSF